MKKLSILCAFCFVLSSFGYTSEDTSNANFLADQGIVTKQTTSTGYRLDDKILRQEAIGMALKMKGVTLPENYTCKKYFADATKNDWICRAVELAADNGIITKSNKYANPGKSITRAEALAILWTAGNMDKKLINDWQITSGLYDASIIYDDANNWQNELIEKARYLKIISPSTYQVKIQNPSMHGYDLHVQFYPNRLATRAEVFGFAKSISQFDNNGYCRVNGIQVKEPCEISADPEGKIVKYGDIISTDTYGDGTYEGRECILRYITSDKPIYSILAGDNMTYEKFGKYQTLKVSFIESVSYYILGNQGYYQLDPMGGKIEDCSVVELDDTRNIRSSDVLSLYYRHLDKGDVGGGLIDWAYGMRSPAGVSLETFQSWYKNVETVTFREDTLKSLGDNTYEFLVDMTDNGVKSTYKVKSKVNLENFTIDNISSVKQ